MGLSECLKSGELWPPSLPVFRAWCKPNRAPPYRHEQERLPAKPSTRERAAEEIAKLRALTAKAKNIGALPYDKHASAEDIERGETTTERAGRLAAAKENARDHLAEWLAKREIAA